MQLQAGTRQQPPSGETPLGRNPGEAERRARICHQPGLAAEAMGLPAGQRPIEAQPWGHIAQGHIGQMEPPPEIQSQPRRHRTDRRPAHQPLELLEPLGYPLPGRRAPAVEAARAGHGPVPSTVADQQPTGPAQMPSPINPGRWMPHSCWRPPNRVARPLTSPASGPLECQSPTLE